MNVENTLAIDVHAHYGRYYRPEITDLANEFPSGDAATVVKRARGAKTEFTIVSPYLGLFPRGGPDTPAGNEEAQQVVTKTEGLLQWVIVNPRQPQTYEQTREMLQNPKCVGIKIHPEEHVYPIKEHGRTIFEFAAEFKALVLAHSGDVHSMPMDFVPFANDFPEVSLIVAHLGNGGRGVGDPSLQVRAIQASHHGNVYTDTSSARSILPRLIEWAVGEVGAEKILYGTDTPIYFAASQRARIDQAEISDATKRVILRDNATRLLASHGTMLAETSPG